MVNLIKLYFKVFRIDKKESGWLKAELNGKEGFVPANYLKLKPCE